jgi:hypothetical protein
MRTYIAVGAATSIAYAVRHPHRVSKLLLYGGYAQGRNKRDSPQDAEEAQAFITMIRKGYGDDRSAFARAFFLFGCLPDRPSNSNHSSSSCAPRTPMGEPP